MDNERGAESVDLLYDEVDEDEAEVAWREVGRQAFAAAYAPDDEVFECLMDGSGKLPAASI
jgi:hypothetical protein